MCVSSHAVVHVPLEIYFEFWRAAGTARGRRGGCVGYVVNMQVFFNRAGASFLVTDEILNQERRPLGMIQEHFAGHWEHSS